MHKTVAALHPTLSLVYFFQGGLTPFIISAAQGHSEVVALLCQRGANIEARDYVSSRR